MRLNQFQSHLWSPVLIPDFQLDHKNIDRIIENDYIIKKIQFIYNNTEHCFEERVKAISLSDFNDCFEQANIRLIHCFGDYQLNDFVEETSERLILIFK